MQTISPWSNCATSASGKAMPSCALACIAACAPRPARPSCFWATSSTAPRGRIYLIKDMLESGRPATEEVVRHVDRRLSCLSCMTTCPRVHYMHLVDHARAYIEDTYRRPLPEKLLCGRCSPSCCPIPAASAWRSSALPARPFARLVPGKSLTAQRLRAMLPRTHRGASAVPRRTAADPSRPRPPPRPRGLADRLRAAGPRARSTRRRSGAC